jgi:hypothetical protein
MASDGVQEDGPPLTELESLQLKANEVTDGSLDSTRRMIQLCEDVSAENVCFEGVGINESAII